jgi:hypothetical protein
LRDTLLTRDAHDSIVDLFDDFWPESPTPAAYCLGVWYLAKSYAGEIAVDKVGTHLTLVNMPVKKIAHYIRGLLAAATRAPKLVRSCTFRVAQLPKLLEIALGFSRQEVASQGNRYFRVRAQ